MSLHLTKKFLSVLRHLDNWTVFQLVWCEDFKYQIFIGVHNVTGSDSVLRICNDAVTGFTISCACAENVTVGALKHLQIIHKYLFI